MNQSRLESLIEAFITVGSGFFVALGIQLLIFPLYGMELTLFQNVQITIIFTVSSIIRSYIVRRCFNRVK